MITFMFIAGVLAAAYITAAISFYYGFKNWSPMCRGVCAPQIAAAKRQQTGSPGEPEREKT